MGARGLGNGSVGPWHSIARTEEVGMFELHFARSLLEYDMPGFTLYFFLCPVLEAALLAWAFMQAQKWQLLCVQCVCSVFDV